MRSAPLRLSAVLIAVATLLLVPVVDRPAPAGAASTDACGALLAKPGGGYWACSFVDTFSGTSLNTAKWLPQNTALSGFSMNKTCFRSGQGYAVSDGTLRLTVRRVAPFVCKTPGADFTTTSVGGAMSTYTKFAQAYGRFEARIKFPTYSGAGLQGGFWMNPRDRAYGPWPASGEIDVAEWYSGVARRLYPSLHYTGRTGADTAYTCLLGDPNAFHRTTVIWSTTRMKFYYDGQLCFDRAWAPTDVEAPAPFDQAFTAALITAHGAGDNAPTSSTPKSATTQVDYVKVWR